MTYCLRVKLWRSASDLLSGSTREMSFEIKVLSPSRVSKMFVGLDILSAEITFHV